MRKFTVRKGCKGSLSFDSECTERAKRGIMRLLYKKMLFWAGSLIDEQWQFFRLKGEVV